MHKYQVIGPSIGYVPLTKGQYALVDAESLPDVTRYEWSARLDKTRGLFYAYRTKWEWMKAVGQVGMHRDLCPEPLRQGYVVDHVNGNPLDNRKCNLRRATRAQNAQNSRVKRNSPTGYKGVSVQVYRPDRTDGKPPTVRYIASLTKDGKRIQIGSFKTAEEAHAAYVEAAKKHFGKFARAA